MLVNAEKTRAYYAALREEDLCDCAYCRNFRREMAGAYPEVAAYLATLGVEAEKAFETSPLEPEDGFLPYCGCEYVVFGHCEEDYFHEIGGVTVRPTAFYPRTGLMEAHFVLSVSPICLPWREDT